MSDEEFAASVNELQARGDKAKLMQLFAEFERLYDELMASGNKEKLMQIFGH
jgi:hypothetical protein